MDNKLTIYDRGDPNILFRAIATEDVETHIDGIEEGSFAYGHYYFCRERMSGVIVASLDEESGGLCPGVVQCHVPVDHATLCAETSFFDRNSNKIYQGDIIQVGTSLGGTWNELVCKEGDEIFLRCNKNIKSILGLGLKPDCLIVGNIFENPELLENNF